MSYFLFGCLMNRVRLNESEGSLVRIKYDVPEIVMQMISENHPVGDGCPFLMVGDYLDDNSESLISEYNIFYNLRMNIKAVSDIVDDLVKNGLLNSLFVSEGYSVDFNSVSVERGGFLNVSWNLLIHENGWDSTKFSF